MSEPIPLSQSLRRKLSAIGYPTPENVSLTPKNPTKFCDTVVWLERNKIRVWNTKKREALIHFSDPQWVVTFAKYLEALDMSGASPTFLSAINNDAHFQHALLDRLASFAVEDVYLDNAEKIHGDESMPSQEGGSRHTRDDHRYQELVGPLNRCLGLFELPHLPNNAPKHFILAALKCVLARVVAPPAQEGDASMDRVEALKQLKAYPSGVKEEGQPDELIALIKILRLLNGNELRETQDVINKSISKLQEITGDPKTDSSLFTSGV